MDPEVDDFLNDDIQDPKRKNMVSFEIDVNGDILDSSHSVVDETDGSVEFEIEGEENDEVITVEEPAAPVVVPQEPEEAPEETERKSRAKERIRDLSKDAKDAKELAKQMQRERDEYRQSLENVSNLYLESEKTRLADEFESVKREIASAAAEQDTEAYANALVKLQDVTSKIQLLNNASPVAPQTKQPTQIPENTSYSTAAEDWMEGKEFIINNEEYAKLTPSVRKQLYPVRQGMADVARELIAEGWDNSTSSFYEELDLRLGLKFDFYEALALEGVDALQSEGKNSQVTVQPSSGETSKPTTRTVEDKKKQVPVSGPTSSGSSTSSRKNSNKIKLSKEDLNWYENHVRWSLGPDNEITMAEYAKMVMDDRKNNG